MSILVCPVCSKELRESETACVCENGHSFDMAREGYVNLLCSSKAGNKTGDNADMARSRKCFLSKGCFTPLAKELCSLIKEYGISGNLLDVCCGEGWYSQYISENCTGISVYGFDLSKEMIRLAAKRKSSASFFVANMARLPVSDSAFSCFVQIFSPFCDKELARVLADDGVAFSVVAGERHLEGLKAVMYNNIYLNDEAPPVAPSFVLCDKRKVSFELTLDNSDDILSLLKMTPYYYHTPESGIEKIKSLRQLTTEIQFVIFVYRKINEGEKKL